MKNFRKSLVAATCASSILFGANVQAEENLWVYTTGTDTRPQGSYEFKLSDTIRIGKDSGSYVFHDIRPEIEYGITDKLTVGAGIMIFDHNYDGVEEGNNPVHETQEDKGGSVSQTRYGGYELALKYNVLSPYKDAFGLSVGFAFEDRDRYRLDGAHIDQQSYVNTIFLQKNFIDNRLTLAFNWKTELERRKSGADSVLEEEIAFDVSAGVSYRFLPKHFLGFEVRRQSDHLTPSENGEKDPNRDSSNFDFNNIHLGKRHQYGVYVGPSYHYAEQNWWYTVGVLFQVAGGGDRQNAFIKNSRNYDEHEKVHVGLSYGYNF